MATKKAKVQPTEKKESNRLVIQGTGFWAHVREVNKLSGKYQLDLSIDAKTVKIIESLGVTVKVEDKNEGVDGKDRGLFVTLKSDYPPKVVDAKKNTMSNDVLIGNGSLIKVATHPYNWTFGKKSGIALGLDAIQIIDLVEYVDSLSDMFEEEEGFTTDDATSSFDDESEDNNAEVSNKRTPKKSSNPF